LLDFLRAGKRATRASFAYSSSPPPLLATPLVVGNITT